MQTRDRIKRIINLVYTQGHLTLTDLTTIYADGRELSDSDLQKHFKRDKRLLQDLGLKLHQQSHDYPDCYSIKQSKKFKELMEVAIAFLFDQSGDIHMQNTKHTVSRKIDAFIQKYGDN